MNIYWDSPDSPSPAARPPRKGKCCGSLGSSEGPVPPTSDGLQPSSGKKHTAVSHQALKLERAYQQVDWITFGAAVILGVDPFCDLSTPRHHWLAMQSRAIALDKETCVPLLIGNPCLHLVLQNLWPRWLGDLRLARLFRMPVNFQKRVNLEPELVKFGFLPQKSGWKTGGAEGELVQLDHILAARGHIGRVIRVQQCREILGWTNLLRFFFFPSCGAKR